MVIARLDVYMVTMICFLVEKKRSGGRHQKDYAETYGRTVETAPNQLTGNGREFVMHWSCGEVKVEEVGLGSAEGRVMVMRIMRVATNV